MDRMMSLVLATVPLMTSSAVLSAASDSFVETLNAWSTFGAASATALSALFIAWQILLTRRSVQATDATLQIAREELDHSRNLQVEAQRAAIDAEMPKLFLAVAHDVEFVSATDTRERDMFAPGGSSPTRVEPGREYVLPRDADVKLEVVVSVTIANDGPRRAELIAGAAYGEVLGMQARALNVGETVSVRFTRVATVEEWAAIHESRSRGESEQVIVGEVTYIFPGDTGAIERHEIAQGGTVLEPVPDHLGAWRVRDLTGKNSMGIKHIGSVVQPFTRQYWESRLGSRPL